MFHLSKDETFIKYVFVNMMTIFKQTIENIDLTRAKSEASVYLLLIIKAKILKLLTESHDQEAKEIFKSLLDILAE